MRYSQEKIFCLILLWITASFFCSEALKASETEQQSLVSEETILLNLDKLIPASEAKLIVNTIEEGDALFSKGDMTLAIQAYEQALILTQQFSLPWVKILIYNRLGQSNYWSVKIEEAAYFFQESMKLVIAGNTMNDTLAVLEALVYLDKCHRKMISNDAFNVDVFYNGMELWEGPQTRNRQTKYHFLKGWLHLNLNEFGKEREHFNLADKLGSENTGANYFWLFIIRYSMAQAYASVKNYDVALVYLQSLEIQIKKAGGSAPYKYFISNSIARIYLTKQRTDLVKNYIQELEKTLDNRMLLFLSPDYLLLGEIYEIVGNFDLAKRNYDRALTILLDNEINGQQLAYVYYFVSRFYRAILDDEAISFLYLKEAEKALDNLTESYMKSYIYYELGLHYYREGDFIHAIFIFNKELDDLDELLNSDRYFTENYFRIARSKFIMVLMRRAATKYYLSKSRNFDIPTLKASYNDYKFALQLYQKFFNAQWFEDSQLSQLREMRVVFNALMNVGYELYLQTQNDSINHELFRIAENSKSILLKKYISDEQAKEFAGVSEEDISISRRMRKEMDILQYGISNQDLYNNDNDKSFLIRKIQEKSEQYWKFDEELQRKYPRYKRLRESEPEIDISNIQKHLLPSQVILEYHIVNKDFYIFYIDKDTLILNYEALEEPIVKGVSAFRGKLENLNYGEFGSNYTREFIEQSNALYKKLIQPFESRIMDKRLLIVPDQELSTIPFEILVSEPYDSLNPHPSFGRIKYLILSNPVAYLYSANQVLQSVSLPGRRIKYVGFAPKYVSFKSSVLELDSLKYALGPLPGAQKEVLSGQKYFGGKYFAEENIDKTKYFKASADATILHLAMHTLLDAAEPMNSLFLFTSNIEKAEEQLHAYEVYSQKNKSALVVLSACNTGRGKVEFGEGVFSIARAFLLAGSKNVVLTQWAVADRSGADIIDKYYSYLSDGYPSDIALQLSKLDFLRTGDPVKAHPYFWGAYIQTGTPIVIKESSQSRNILLLVLVLVVLGGAYLINKK